MPASQSKLHDFIDTRLFASCSHSSHTAKVTTGSERLRKTCNLSKSTLIRECCHRNTEIVAIKLLQTQEQWCDQGDRCGRTIHWGTLRAQGKGREQGTALPGSWVAPESPTQGRGHLGSPCPPAPRVMSVSAQEGMWPPHAMNLHARGAPSSPGSQSPPSPMQGCWGWGRSRDRRP